MQKDLVRGLETLIQALNSLGTGRIQAYFLVTLDAQDKLRIIFYRKRIFCEFFYSPLLTPPCPYPLFFKLIIFCFFFVLFLFWQDKAKYL